MATCLFRLLTVLALGGGLVRLTAQEVQLTSGDVLAGTVVEVAKNRAKIKTADGALRQVPVREIACSRAADGTTKYHPAALVDGPIGPEANQLLARLQKGDAVLLPELMRPTEACSPAFVDELEKLLASKSTATRTGAARTLALAATPETSRLALETALAESDPAMLREVASLLMAGAALGALQTEDGKALVERGLASKDRRARGSCAWVAAKLGSAAALPVLTTFLTDSDHHVRESTAECLAECGNDAGAKILMTMASRERSPAMDANRGADDATKALVERAVRRERVRCCELLGRLRHAAAVPTLRTLATNKDADVAAAAKKALDQVEAGSGPGNAK